MVYRGYKILSVVLVHWTFNMLIFTELYKYLYKLENAGKYQQNPLFHTLDAELFGAPIHARQAIQDLN